MPKLEEAPKRYIGDGVYAIYDGFGMWLHANDHANPTDRVYLEPEVMRGLVDFFKQCVKEANENDARENEVGSETDTTG